MEEQTKERLVAELRDYLDALPATACDTGDVDANGDNTCGREVDLYTLFTELAGLKNEVQRESRQIKRALDEFSDIFSTLETQGQRLGSELDARRKEQAETASNAQRGLLLELIDLRDRLAQAHDMTANDRPGWWQRLFARRHVTRAQDMADGLAITLRRLDQTLASYHVAPIETAGRVIDPHRMRVTSVRADPNQDDGIVLEEIRRGYCQGDEVLRLAEIVANKIGD